MLRNINDTIGDGLVRNKIKLLHRQVVEDICDWGSYSGNHDRFAVLLWIYASEWCG